jgi:hypothetical protein
LRRKKGLAEEKRAKTEQQEKKRKSLTGLNK